MDEKKSLKDWTLAECKDCCEKHLRCSECPLAGKICGDKGFGAPHEWPIGE